MSDGIITTSNQLSGTYRRLREFAGPNRDEHEVEMFIEGPIRDKDGTELVSVSVATANDKSSGKRDRKTWPAKRN